MYESVLRFCKRRTRSEAEARHLQEIGKLVGLNSTEVDKSTSSAISLSSIPTWLRIVLIAIAVIFGSVIIYVFARQATYVPGTDYASIKPDDFMVNSNHSLLLIMRNSNRFA